MLRARCNGDAGGSAGPIQTNKPSNQPTKKKPPNKGSSTETHLSKVRVPVYPVAGRFLPAPNPLERPSATPQSQPSAKLRSAPMNDKQADAAATSSRLDGSLVFCLVDLYFRVSDRFALGYWVARTARGRIVEQVRKASAAPATGSMPRPKRKGGDASFQQTALDVPRSSYPLSFSVSFLRGLFLCSPPFDRRYPSCCYPLGLRATAPPVKVVAPKKAAPPHPLHLHLNAVTSVHGQQKEPVDCRLEGISI